MGSRPPRFRDRTTARNRTDGRDEGFTGRRREEPRPSSFGRENRPAGGRGRDERPDVRGKESARVTRREEELRGRKELNFRGRDEPIQQREEFRSMRREEERRDRNRKRSRSPNRNPRQISRERGRERRSRSAGRRTRSAERKNIRFEPPEHRPQEPEYIPRQRSLSNERRFKQDQSWVDDRIGRFSPPPEGRFAPEEFDMHFRSAPTFEKMYDNQIQPVGSGSVVMEHGFGMSHDLGPPSLMSQPLMNKPGFMQNMGNQGFSQTKLMDQDFSQMSGSFMNKPLQERNDNLDDEQLIPEFNPETSQLSSYDWMKLLEFKAKEYDWKKDEKQYIMASRLGGFARQWYLTVGVNLKDFRELKQAFLRAFPTEMSFHAHLEAMLERKKEGNETMASYFHHKVALLNACEIHGIKAVSCIIGGLTDARLRQLARTKNCEDPDELYIYLRSCDAESPKKTEEPKPKNAANKTPAKQQVETKKCFLCKSVGHMKYQCPLRFHKCSVCSKIGHECTKEDKPKDNQKYNQVMHGSLSQKPTYSQYFTDVNVNGVHLEAYVDQGSECTTIREENALLLKLPVKKQYKVIRGFAGTSISSMGIVEMPLCVGRAIANVRLFVVPDHLQAIPVIVGQSFTEQPHVVVMKDGDKIRFYQRMDNGETNFDF